ncbi:hypothetical protein PMAC_002192 [Pneumocystis sp. 'macacae']|nr:hypothetical protein PMAC_002192 [Pneumocystis sp. 'macacae']
MFNILLSQLLELNDPINQIHVLLQIRQLIIDNEDSKLFFRECKGFEKIMFFLCSNFLNNEIKNTQQKLDHDSVKQSIQVICLTLTLLSTAISRDPFNTYYFFRYCNISSFILKTTFLQNDPETLLGILFSFALNEESLQSSFKSIKEELKLGNHEEKEIQEYTFNKLNELIRHKFSEEDIIINSKILPLILYIQKNLKTSWHRLSILLIFNSLLGNCVSEINLIAFTNNKIPSTIIRRLFGNDPVILNSSEKKLFLELITKLCRNGLSREDIFFLIQEFSKNLTKNKELSSFLLHLFSQNQSPSHIQFNMSLYGYSCIQFSSLYKLFPSLNGYSMLLWIRFDMFDETLDTNILGVLDNQKKYICKLFLDKHNKNLSFQTSFKNLNKFSFYNFEKGLWYHIALIHQKSKSVTSSKLSLFVNGLYIETIECPYPSIDQDKLPIQLFIGMPQELCISYRQNKSLVKWSLSSFLIIEDIVNENIINLYYYSGPYYNWNYQNSLKNSIRNSISVLNILEKITYIEKIIETNMAENKISASILNDKILFYICEDSILNINSFNRWDDSEKIIKKIIQSVHKKLTNDLIILNKAVPFSSNYIITQTRLGLLLGNPVNVVVNNIEDSIYCIGGPVLGLKLIEISETPNDIIYATKLTLSFIKNSKRNLENMEKNYGYGILSKILKSKEDSALNIDLLNSILLFLGYDETDSKYYY